MVIKRYFSVPNIITMSRIMLTIILYFLVNDGVFIYIYAITGFTDILDGYLARKLKTESKFGSKLDSVADMFLFVFIMYFIFIKNFNFIEKNIAVYAILLFLKLTSILITYIRFKEIAIIHTIGNKILGVFIFLIPIIIYRNNFYVEICLLVFSMVALLDEFLISILSRDFDINRKTFISSLRKK
ncbi:CDP-alcohol phosphatidyltransferase [Alteracholeplasma palmae J233]|uniref:CDP-alcohol phosphatidyltransferase n=1 Tax=Alteracholeplasma palmae (strain ATCC 49389 / J233) TaxID=1318466 RepID=U4KRH5_ALTPJ|nr:CDP-alcohol phosphatidyltransferase family protein [Alteracholeplasma palmae]CCV64171.1 CDP-alcohol phosphatidyltransferase [Alteracholeplasma palmae J233]